MQTQSEATITVPPPDWRDFSPDQWQCIVSTARWLILSAVIRSGKTRTAAYAFLHRLKRDFRNPRIHAMSADEPIRYWVGAPTYRLNIPQKIYLVPKLIESGLIDTKAQGSMTVGTSVTKGGGAIHLVGNRLIEFVSLDTPDSLVGATVRAAWISEIARCEEKAVDETIGRMTNFADSWMVGDTSPFGRGWFYRRYIEPLTLGNLPNGELVQWSYESMLKWIESRYFTGAPFLFRSEFEARQKQLPSWMFRRDYLGLWENAVGQVYPNWSPVENVVANDADTMRKVGYRFYVAADLNSTQDNPAHWITFAHNPYTGQFHVHREHSMIVGLEPKLYVARLMETAKACGAKSIIPDPSMPVAIKYALEDGGYEVMPADPTIDTGLRRMSQLIGERMLTCDPSCENFQNEIAEYRFTVDKYGNSGTVPDKKKFDAHALDACRYAVMALSR